MLNYCNKTIVRNSTFVVVCLFVAGCISVSTFSDEDRFSTPTELKIATVGAADQCSSSIDVSNNVFNDEAPEERGSLSGVFAADYAGGAVRENISGDAITLTDTRYDQDQVYVGQLSPDTCYAAVLAIIWRAAGIKAAESDFVRAVKDTCKNRSRDSANYLQILSSAYYAHEGRRYDFIKVPSSLFPINLAAGSVTSADTRGGTKLFWSGVSGKCVLGPLCIFSLGTTELNKQNSAGDEIDYSDRGYLSPATVEVTLYGNKPSDGIRWASLTHRPLAGGVRPLQSAINIVHAIKNGAFVIAGFRNDSVSHVVIIDGLHIALENNRIDRIRIVDPANEFVEHQWIDTDKGGRIDGLTFVVSFENI